MENEAVEILTYYVEIFLRELDLPFLEGKSKGQLHVHSSDRARVWCVVISIENKSFEIFFGPRFGVDLS